MSKTSDKSEEIENWLNSIDSNNDHGSDEDGSCSSVVESSIIETSSSSESGEELELGDKSHFTQFKKYENVIPQMAALTFNNISISNSTNVYLGHIYKVNGSLNINVIHCEEPLEEDKLQNKNVAEKEKSPVKRHACLIFPRHRWLAMDPMSESIKLLEPVEIVVISYTATISSTLSARNIGIIRDFQTLNVEGQGFNDIIYNFLIGCDGVVYEGRGWGIEGDHTSGYNKKSIGVAFVGNFKRDLPTERALRACQNLFTRGISEGHLSKDYKIITSFQRFSNTNLNALHEEITKWEHFCDRYVERQ